LLPRTEQNRSDSDVDEKAGLPFLTKIGQQQRHNDEPPWRMSNV